MFPMSSAAKEPPMKMKKASPSLSPSSFPLTSLPEDLSLNCLARVSSPELAALPCVSRRYRSLVASSEFKNMRSELGFTEDRLYVCLYNCSDPNKPWYVIRREKLNAVNRLVMSPIPPCPSPRKHSSVVALGWGIYVIGGILDERPSSDVFLLDCRTNTWRDVPSMGVARAYAAAGVVDGKIYVFGGHRTYPFNWGEVFDPKTQTWNTLVPDMTFGNVDCSRSLVKEEKVYAVVGLNAFYYSPGEAKWGTKSMRDLFETEDKRWKVLLGGCGTNLGKLIFGLAYISGEFFWRESDGRGWKKVKGLEGRFYGEKHIEEVSNFGLNILFFWYESKVDRREICCCEISLKRVEEKGEVWGTIEWSGVVGTLYYTRYGYPFGAVLYAASVTV